MDPVVSAVVVGPKKLRAYMSSFLSGRNMKTLLERGQLKLEDDVFKVSDQEATRNVTLKPGNCRCRFGSWRRS